MRILISAYACEPGKGSEPEVGLQIVLAAASEHEVWVITRENNIPALEEFLMDHPLRARIHLVGLEVGGLARRLKKHGGLVTLHWYYDKWQRALGDLASRLDAVHDFDVVHHATFATYWTRTGVTEVDKPLVWGPVGGGVRPPWRLIPVMGIKGACGDTIRLVSRPLIAMATGYRRTVLKAGVVMAQNPETASRLSGAAVVMILPNALIGITRFEEGSWGPRIDRTENTTLVCVGRLIGWKGTWLAIEALRHLVDDGTALHVFGDGPQRTRLVRRVAYLGLEKRVHFMGMVTRHQVLEAVARADVLVHSSLHDEASLAVAEALTLGTPVVVVNRGGPPVVAGHWPDNLSAVIDPSTPHVTALRMSSAIETVLGRRGFLDTSPSAVFENALLQMYAKAKRPDHLPESL